MPKSFLRTCCALIIITAYLAGDLNAQNKPVTPCFAAESAYNYASLPLYREWLSKTEATNAASLDSKYRRQYNEIIEGKNAALVKQITDKGFLFDEQLHPYLRSILDQVLEQNGLDKSRFHFFVDRTSNANAYSFEDGTIVCDLGLFTILQNESQVAMVFCHELGHVLLGHVNQSIARQLEKLNSPQFLAKLRHIKHQEYNTKSQLEDLMMGQVFDKTRHTRTQENAADSLGMLLFSHTKYGGVNVARVFDILDSSDYKLRFYPIRQFFKAEQFSADDEWFKPVKKMSFGGSTPAIPVDSLKTHPDCAQRKMVMQAYFNAHPKAGADFLIGNAVQFEKIKQVARFDEAAYARQCKDLGYCLYLLIQYDILYPDNACVKTEIFNTLTELCNHQHAHDINTVVNNPYATEDDGDEYAKLLQVLDNQTLKSLTAIAATYYNNHKTLINASDEAISNLNK